MTQAETACPDAWGSHFLEYRGRLLALARRNLNPVLARRVSAEDVVQEALLAACGKMAFFENNPEIPVYFKLRTILFQTLTAMERKHLQCLKRDAHMGEQNEIDALRKNAALFKFTEHPSPFSSVPCVHQNDFSVAAFQQENIHGRRNPPASG